MASESKLMMDLNKQVLDSQGQLYINFKMGDSFQFTFNSVGVHKKKSYSQQVRDNLRKWGRNSKCLEG